MAGIGFELRRLARKDDLLGIMRAFIHSGLASTGPWIFTIIALGFLNIVGSTGRDDINFWNFRVIVNYNFAFSLIASAPSFMVATRFLADSIFYKNVTRAPGLFFGTLLITYGLSILPVGYYYFVYTELHIYMRIMAFLNFFLIVSVWAISIFLTALKDYKSITFNFFIGMALAIVLGFYLDQHESRAGILLGFNIGLAYIFFALSGKIFAEYPYYMSSPMYFVSYFKKHWHSALGGLFYNAAIWIDKVVMLIWAPEAITLPSKLVTYPDYESAIYLAFLSAIPALAVFIYSVETNFFERYHGFYYSILNHASFEKIRRRHGEIIVSLTGSSKNFLILQGAISLTFILLLTKLVPWLGINYQQIGMIRVGILGAFFHVMSLFIFIILYYFDMRKSAMYLQLLFLVSNGVITYITIQMGISYYGMGYLISSLLVFVASAFVLFRYLEKLPYHTFITQNSAIRKKVL